MTVPVVTPKSLGAAVRDARERGGLTQQRLADLAAVTQPTLSNLERGKNVPSLPTLLRILAAVGLELVVRDRAKPEASAPWDEE